MTLPDHRRSAQQDQQRQGETAEAMRYQAKMLKPRRLTKPTRVRTTKSARMKAAN